MERLRDQALASAVFAGDQNIGVGRRNAGDELDDRAHARRIGNNVRHLAAEEFVLGLELLAFAQGAGERDLGADNGKEAIVIPGFGDEIARAEFHRLDREIDGRPGGHDDDRQGLVQRLEARDGLEAFLPRGGVAVVIQIHHEKRVGPFLDRVKDRA